VVRNFINDALAHATLSPKRNVGLYAPWSEQGLGELARIYGRVLRRSGLRVHVLSFQAYEAKDRGVAIQHTSADWAAGKDADTVHYSLNDREHVTLHEMSQFISTKNVGRLLYPELRLLTNWQKIANLKIRNLEAIAVPMIESVGKSEVPNHNYLHRTWCVTRQCENVLREMGVKNTSYIGHGFGPRLTREAIDQKKAIALSRERIVFCHMGGHNPHFRKRTANVIEAFTLAAERRDDICLRVYMMRNFSGVSKAHHPRISYHLGSLPHSEVLAAYRSSDVSIQVASHEGLGLGFYESLAMGTPIVSLDLAPHNEVVRPGVSGWLLPVQPAPRAHPQGVVPGGHFNVADLADAMLRIRKQEVANMIDSAAQLHRSTFDEYAMAERLGAALWQNPESD
jgi:glycosyltransferase involved in cell wall biosynthesis